MKETYVECVAARRLLRKIEPSEKKGNRLRKGSFNY